MKLNGPYLCLELFIVDIVAFGADHQFLFEINKNMQKDTNGISQELPITYSSFPLKRLHTKVPNALLC